MLSPDAACRHVACLLMAALLLTGGCSQGKPESAQGGGLSADGSAELEAQIREFCSACHVFPPPSSFPASAWEREVRQGFEFYERSQRNDLHPPEFASAVEWFRARAPQSLEVPPADADSTPTTLRLTRGRLAALPADGPFAVSHLNCIPDAEGRLRLFVCEMFHGGIWLARPGSSKISQLARVPHPCRIARTDLDGDGHEDFVIAALGSVFPEDHDRGGVWWLREDAGEWTCVPLVERLGRVSDVQPLDADGDGDIDLVAAEFGWRETGRVLWLQNVELRRGVPELRVHVLDPRHGALQTCVADLTGDGRDDFVALIAQEHEVVEVFENQGRGKFVARRVYAADDPAFGSSAMQLVDLDGDGDLDVLYANGDTLDSIVLKPYHGVRWLENQGGLSFTPHELAALPGACGVRAADLDGDGDQDVVATTLLPAEVVHSTPSGRLASVIWLENQGGGRFTRHLLETDACEHAACELADWDGDGRIDVLLGPFFHVAPEGLTWYRNAPPDRAAALAP